MTSITKDELMQMAEKTGSTSYRNRADTANPAYGFSAAKLAEFANAILERAEVQMKAEAAKINWATTSEWGEGWCCGAQDALDGAEVAIRALKINTGD